MALLNPKTFKLEFSNDQTDATLLYRDLFIDPVYEIGIELPMDFANEKNIDENKLCKLLDIDGIPISVTSCAGPEFGRLKGKPALFIATRETNETQVITWAKDSVNRVSNFDFADYYITHGESYAALEKEDAPGPKEHPELKEIENDDWAFEENDNEKEVIGE